MNGLIKETAPSFVSQEQPGLSAAAQHPRIDPQTAVSISSILSADSGLQLVCGQKGLKAVNKSFPLNFILTKHTAFLKLENSSEMCGFQLCY